MLVILVFIGFVLVGDAAAIFIASFFEQVSQFASLLVFLALFISVFVGAWLLAVRVVERFFMPAAVQPPAR